MIISAHTEPGDSAQPNEDWYGFADQPGPIVVIDGGTARTDTGCIHGVAWYAEQFGTELLQLLRGSAATLQELLAEGIQTVAARHSGTCDLGHPGTPSAAVGMIRPAAAGAWEYAILGDITILIESTFGLTFMSDARIGASASAERAAADRWPIGSPEKQLALLDMKHAELAARNKTYWIAAADPDAAEQAVTGHVTEVTQVAVMTDGAARIEAFGLGRWSEILAALNKVGPAELINDLRREERLDSSGQRWNRNKVSDDATIVHLAVR